jgi:hypothetical protein
MKIKSILATAALSTLLLTGCGEESTVTEDPSVGSNAKETEAEPEPEKTTEAPKENPKFGETVTYENGLQITVSKPKEFKPTDTAAVTEDAAKFLSFDVLVVNNTGKNFDPSMIYMSLQSGDTEGEEVFDSEGGYEGTPSTKLLDGRQAKYKVGFGVADPNDLNTGDFEQEATLYTN